MPSHPDYTPNPARAIHVQGPFSQELIYRLTPQILTLQAKSREPITVYIDSPGGPTIYMQMLRTLLGTSNQLYERPCKLITVATTLAASAGADMLAAGDYALAYPDSIILYHGLRTPSDKPLTEEESLSLAQSLRSRNDSFALGLAREAEYRFIFRFISLKDQFDLIRQQDPDANDLICLYRLLGAKLSNSALQAFETALDRYIRYNELLGTVFPKTLKGKANKSQAAIEAAEIKAIVDFEVKDNKKNKDWGFLPNGIQRLTDDFLLLHEYMNMFQGQRFMRLCTDWSDFLLNDADKAEIDAAPEAERPDKIVEKVRPQLRPIWSFFVALCYVLQHGEHELTATDAFWLGLIDEVIGVQDLPYLRVLIEHANANAQQKEEQEEHPGEGTAEAAAGA